MSDTNELERLRADLDAITKMAERYCPNDDFVLVGDLNTVENVLRNKIAKLKEAKADPWADAKQILKKYKIFANDFGEFRPVGLYVHDLEARNATQKARIAEQNGCLEEWDKVAWRILPSFDAPPEPSHVMRRVEELESRIAGLDARPVPPLDPKRVIATACKEIAKHDKYMAAYIMQVFQAGNAGIYTLAGDETT